MLNLTLILTELLQQRKSKFQERKAEIVDRMISSLEEINEKNRKRYRQMLDRVLNGKVEDPHVSVLARIAEAMGGQVVIRFQDGTDGKEFVLDSSLWSK